MAKHPARLLKYDDLVAGLSSAISNGNVGTVTDGDLTLYRYTEQCSWAKQWDQFSLLARGLILDTTAKRIVATPFPKFFNYGEGHQHGQPMAPLPQEPFTVTEKMDGSLGIVFWHNDRWRVATKGSFNSEQAQWAQQHLGNTKYLDTLTTYLVEIIYPENRIRVGHHTLNGL